MSTKLNLLILLLLGATALSSCRVSTASPPVDEFLQQQRRQQQQRVVELESQLDGLRHTNGRWQILCASLGVGAFVSLILGTALGAKTRHDALTTP